MATGTNSIPERLINYRVYNEANALMGMATVDLPELQAMSDTVSGAGIAGEVDSPVLGHYQAMSSTFNWRTLKGLLSSWPNSRLISWKSEVLSSTTTTPREKLRPLPFELS